MKLLPEQTSQTEQTLKLAVINVIRGTEVPTVIETSAKERHKYLRLTTDPIPNTGHADFRIYCYYKLAPRSWLDKLLRVKRYTLQRVSNSFLGTWDSPHSKASTQQQFEEPFKGDLEGKCRCLGYETVEYLTKWDSTGATV